MNTQIALIFLMTHFLHPSTKQHAHETETNHTIKSIVSSKLDEILGSSS